jgi:hypothetical protein
MVLCFAGLFGGYRIGFDRGYAAGDLKHASEELYNRVYEVGDLVTLPDGTTDYDSLLELLTSTIAPESWDDIGGPGSVKEFKMHQSLVILQRGDLHREIDKLFEQLRAIRSKTDTAATMPAQNNSAK